MNRLTTGNGTACVDTAPSLNDTNGKRTRRKTASGAPSTNATNGARVQDPLSPAPLPRGEGEGRQGERQDPLTPALLRRSGGEGRELPASGKDSRGRFTIGNAGGPGNPFARQTAGLRKRLVARVTEEDLDAIADRLIQQAKDGDVASIKVLLSYVIGKPTEAVDPDTLDVQEWNLFRQQPVEPDDMEQIVNRMPANLASELMRYTLPAVRARFAGTMLDQMAERGWPEVAAVRKEATPPPSAKTEATTSARRGSPDPADLPTEWSPEACPTSETCGRAIGGVGRPAPSGGDAAAREDPATTSTHRQQSVQTEKKVARRQ